VRRQNEVYSHSKFITRARSSSSDANKDLGHRDQDQDQDLTLKDKDKDKDLSRTVNLIAICHCCDFQQAPDKCTKYGN